MRRFGAFRLLARLSKTTLGLVIVALLVLNITTGVLAVASTAFFGLLSAGVELVTGASTVRQRYTAREADLIRTHRASLDGVRSANVDEVAGLRRTFDVEIAQRDRRIDTLTGEVADLREAQFVTFRGQRRLATEVVTETSEAMSRRVLFASQRNIASMAGESIPFWGIGVIVAATVWEVADSCQMMGDIYDMQIALAPETAIPPYDTEVCGLRVPTTAEIWASIKASPRAVWDGARSRYASLPEVNFSGPYEWALSLFADEEEALTE